MTRAREHLSMAEARLEFGTTENDDRYLELAKISYLAAIAHTLADMADQEADTKPQPRLPDYGPRFNPYGPVTSTVRDVDLASPADRAGDKWEPLPNRVDLASPADGKNPE